MKHVLPALVLLSVISCGGSSPSAPSTFTQQVAGTVGVFGTNEHAFSASRAGTLTVTLRWSTATDLDLYLTNAACQINNPNACTILAAANGATGTQEVITRTVTKGDAFKLVVDNNSETLSSPYTLDIAIQ